DQAVPQLSRDRLPELVSDGEALLKDRWKLVEQFLADWRAIERDDLLHLIDGEVACVNRRHRLDDFAAASVEDLKHGRNHRVIFSLALRPALDNGRLELLHELREDSLELVRGAHGTDKLPCRSHRVGRRGLRCCWPTIDKRENEN